MRTITTVFWRIDRRNLVILIYYSYRIFIIVSLYQLTISFESVDVRFSTGLLNFHVVNVLHLTVT